MYYTRKVLGDREYYRVRFMSGEGMYVTARSMESIELWVLQNRSMNDFYGMNICQVNEDKSRVQNGDFSCNAVREYWHSEEMFGNDSDEKIRRTQIAVLKNIIKNGQKVYTDDSDY